MSSGLGAISSAIRFITYLPWFVLIFYAFPDYKELKHHPELRSPPYKQTALVATACAGAAVSAWSPLRSSGYHRANEATVGRPWGHMELHFMDPVN
jgi:hypothetical protein